ncbi:upstream stimulatory factor 2-like isoform X2 [Pseudomyrmex gracilis]|uniref:upstream stimulatory factor 2-like isoform X2 n=1 Tax=Pseudomyrmex gracilis TaxID=219809 RepID=UPI000994B4DD|nr:upstream stimulatory factor 2-like isoform X2 [Pseudomyrmex gracilis]
MSLVDEHMSDESVGVALEDTEVVECEPEPEIDDDNIQYHLYAVKEGSENTVTYKVMQVGDTHRETNEVAVATPVNNTVQILTSPLNGQFYVLSNSNEIVTSESTRVSPRVAKLKIDNGQQNAAPVMKKRDDRRRVTHNEVERRRRDKINTWISRLGKLLEECEQDINKEGDAKSSFESQSKGGILARACEYITELKETQEKLTQVMDERSQLTEEVKELRQIVNQLRDDNSKLKAEISEKSTFTVV